VIFNAKNNTFFFKNNINTYKEIEEVLASLPKKKYELPRYYRAKKMPPKSNRYDFFFQLIENIFSYLVSLLVIGILTIIIYIAMEK
jgi:hypothetical protein